MSVYDPEPKVSSGDTGQGLVVCGGILLFSDLVMWIAIPPHLRVAGYVTMTFWVALVVSIVLLVWGHFLEPRDHETVTDSEMQEIREAHAREERFEKKKAA